MNTREYYALTLYVKKEHYTQHSVMNTYRYYKHICAVYNIHDIHTKAI